MKLIRKTFSSIYQKEFTGEVKRANKAAKRNFLAEYGLKNSAKSPIGGVEGLELSSKIINNSKYLHEKYRGAKNIPSTKLTDVLVSEGRGWNNALQKDDLLRFREKYPEEIKQSLVQNKGIRELAETRPKLVKHVGAKKVMSKALEDKILRDKIRKKLIEKLPKYIK